MFETLRLVLAATLQGAYRLQRQSDLRAHGTNEARRHWTTLHGFHPPGCGRASGRMRV
jgi:hypothetical protein